MNIKATVLISALVVMVFLGAGCQTKDNVQQPPTPATLNASLAIELIKDQFPELKDYPSDKLPPRSIRSEKATDGWHVAFVQEGSGRPIISAKCYLIDDQKNIMSEKTYDPSPQEDTTADFSPITCTPGACALENCHGLDIKCGPNPPEMCTAMYGIGDKCLQYAKCGIQDGKCQQVPDPQFTKCKTCVQACIKANQDDNIKMFDCESKCE